MLMFYSCDYRKKWPREKKKKPTEKINTRQSVKLSSHFSKNSFGLKTVVVNIVKLLDLFHQRPSFQCGCHIRLLSGLQYPTSQTLNLLARRNQLLFAATASKNRLPVQHLAQGQEQLLLFCRQRRPRLSRPATDLPPPPLLPALPSDHVISRKTCREQTPPRARQTALMCGVPHCCK